MTTEESGLPRDHEYVRVCGQCGGTPCPMGCQTPGWQRFQPCAHTVMRVVKSCTRCSKLSRMWQRMQVNGTNGVFCDACLGTIIKFK